MDGGRGSEKHTARAAVWRELVVSGMLQYYIWQYELCPDTQRIHVQGYLIARHRMRLSELKKYVSARAHFEKALGTTEDNIAYCSKSDSSYGMPVETHGDPGAVGQGKRSDLSALRDEIKADPAATLEKAMDRHDSAWRYTQATRLYIQSKRAPKTIQQLDLVSPAELKPDERNFAVVAFWGDTGSGKTYRSIDMLNKFVGMFDWRIYTKTKGNANFDNYDDEELVFWDEFSNSKSQAACNLDTFLTLTDRYRPFAIQSRYNDAKFNSLRLVIFTAPVSPRYFFKDLSANEEKSVLRRFSMIHECDPRPNPDIYEIPERDVERIPVIDLTDDQENGSESLHRNE
jgi:hypothetical protein